MRRRQLGSALLSLSLGWQLSRALPAYSAPARAESFDIAGRIKSEFGIEVRWAADPGLKAKLGLSPHEAATALADDDVIPSLEAIKGILQVYSPGFLRRAGLPILLCSDLNYDNNPICALARLTDNYVLAGNLRSRERQASFSRGVHYLLAAPIGYLGAVDRVTWEATNRSHFQYVLGDDPALIEPLVRDGSTERQLEALHNYGLVDSRGQLTLWTDFTGYVLQVFTQPEEFVGLATRFPIMKAKTLLLMQAYEQVDAEMGQVFDRLGLGVLRTGR